MSVYKLLYINLTVTTSHTHTHTHTHKRERNLKIILKIIIQSQGKRKEQKTTNKMSTSTYLLVLLLLLSHFSRVRLCATRERAAHQALPFLGFSRQEHWSGLPFPLQCMKVKSESEVAQSCPTLRDPMDCSLPGSSIHGIF